MVFFLKPGEQMATSVPLIGLADIDNSLKMGGKTHCMHPTLSATIEPKCGAERYQFGGINCAEYELRTKNELFFGEIVLLK